MKPPRDFHLYCGVCTREGRATTYTTNDLVAMQDHVIHRHGFSSFGGMTSRLGPHGELIWSFQGLVVFIAISYEFNPRRRNPLFSELPKSSRRNCQCWNAYSCHSSGECGRRAKFWFWKEGDARVAVCESCLVQLLDESREEGMSTSHDPIDE